MKRKKPVVCTTIIDGWRGLVLRTDLNAASELHWEKVGASSGSRHYDPLRGEVIKVPRSALFVFHAVSDQYYQLVDNCHVERAVFHIGDALPDQKLEFLNAHNYIHKGIPVPRLTAQESFDHLEAKGWLGITPPIESKADFLSSFVEAEKSGLLEFPYRQEFKEVLEGNRERFFIKKGSKVDFSKLEALLNGAQDLFLLQISSR